MRRIKRARPSPALVISIVAMFAALGGGAFAATATVSKKALDKKGNLKKNVVKKKNIANGAINTKKLKDGKVAGSKLSDDSVSASKLGSISEVSETSPPAIMVPALTATATCPDGSKVIGGGYEATPFEDISGDGVIVYMNKRTDNGWKADGTALDGGETITAYAYCLVSSG